MLSVLRKNAGSWLVKVVLGAIVIVFMFWGVGSYRERERTRVAVVNGTIISLNEYDTTYNALLEQIRQRFGNNLNEDLIKSLQLRTQALNQLIDQKLLLGEAARQNLRVTDSELSGAIMKMAAFQSAGAFNARIYDSVLSRNRLNPKQFEALQRDGMLIGKLRSYIENNAKVSEPEGKDYYRWKNTSVNLDYFLFSPDQYTGIYPTTEEIQTYYEDHKGSYMTDAKVRVRYLNLESGAYASQVTISDEEVADYYDSHLEEFEIEKTVEARHILIKVDAESSPEVVEEKNQKAQDVLKMAREGQDFAALAKKYSEGPTSKVGGKLGAFKRDAMEKPFSDKAFSMEVNEISDPVRTRFGWHIIKVEEINEASTSPIAEAEADIRKTLVAEQTKGLAFDAAQEILDTSFEGDDLVEAAEANGMMILTSTLFTRSDPDKALKDHAKVATAAFKLSSMEISEMIDHSDGYYILQVIEKIPEKIADLGEVRETARTDLIKELQDDKARDAAESFLSTLKKDTIAGDESRASDLIPEVTGFFKRSDPIPQIGYEREIASLAFTLSEDKPVPDTVIKGNRGYYVIKYKDRKDPDIVGYDAEKAEIQATLLQQKRASLFDALLTQLKDTSTIEIEERFRE